MPKYCEKCRRIFDKDSCPVCGDETERQVLAQDLCFLTEREQMWGDMLADVLEQHNIPFVFEKLLGAGLAIRSGPMFERLRFYVYFEHLTEAQQITDLLFGCGHENKENSQVN